MVSKARLDLPEPDSPVTTMSLSRGISSEMFLRLWTRAPCTAMVVRAAVFAIAVAVLEPIRLFPHIHKRHLLDHNVAPLGELDRCRRLADEPLVGQILARRCHTLYVEVSLEVVLDFGRRTRFTHLPQMVDHRTEQLRGTLRDV